MPNNNINKANNAYVKKSVLLTYLQAGFIKFLGNVIGKYIITSGFGAILFFWWEGLSFIFASCRGYFSCGWGGRSLGGPFSCAYR